jgi:hypothetical protein
MKYLTLLLLLCSCSITVEPGELVPCKHELSRKDGWVQLRIRSDEDYADVCISTEPRNVRCSRYYAAYFPCIRFRSDVEVTVEVYEGENYCAEKI